MSYTYKTSPVFLTTPTQSAYITADKHAQMSQAWNERVRYGIGDVSRRIHQYILGQVRQIRNPAAPVIETATVWPALAEFSEYYAYLKQDNAHWPDQEPGEYEGINLANPAGAFVFGNPQYDGEGRRLNTDMQNLAVPGDPEVIWEMAKFQRGAIDLSDGNQYVPMFEAAQSHMQLVSPHWSFHGKSYGGLPPVPLVKGYCKTGGGSVWNDSVHVFTNLDSGLTVTYPGTCGPGAIASETNAPGSGDDVQAIYDYPFAWFVLTYSNALHRYDKSDWIYGPLTGGGSFQRLNSDATQRLMLNPFLSEFRGTDEQRTGNCFDLSAMAFDYEYFYKSQYFLSPARGQTAGAQIAVLGYPHQTFTGTITDGAATPLWTIHSGYRFAGHILRQSGAMSPITLVRFENNIETGRFVMQPDTASMIVLHPTGSTGTVQFRIINGFTFPSGAYADVEIAELYDYKPEVWDAYAYIRLCSSTGGNDDTPDLLPDDETYSAVISDYYKNTGAVVNIHNQLEVGEQNNYINSNPVYEQFRKQVMEWTRVMNRQQLIGYEVIDGPTSGSQHSVLYFLRYILDQGGALDMDAFYGIVNNADSGSNGIVTSAPPQGWTNEWVMDISTKMYGGPLTAGGENASEWKPEAYGDYFPMLQRCHLLDPFINENNNPDMFGHFQQTTSDGQIGNLFYGMLMAPEALSAYNYIRGTNSNQYRTSTQLERQQFYKSCQIYPDPYNIYSSSVVIEDSTYLVRIELDKRLQYNPDITPGLVNRDTATWDWVSLRDDEPYRTDENAIMQYLLHMTGIPDGTLEPKIGDQAMDARGVMSTSTGTPHGSIIPHFFFTKLIPTPYLKEYGYGPGVFSTAMLNDPEFMYSASTDPDKTVITYDRFFQMETYLRAMCEGFINNSKVPHCEEFDETNSGWDYTYEDLWFNATSGSKKWFSVLPEAVRADNPQGYGPPPNTVVYAEALNNLSACMNKLNRVRVPLPYQLLIQKSTYEDTFTVELTEGQANCSLNGTIKTVARNLCPSAATTLRFTGSVESPGGEEPGGVARTLAYWSDTDTSCSGSTFYFTSSRETIAYSFTPTDPDALLAMNANLQSRYLSTDNGFFARIVEEEFAICNTPITDIQNESSCDCKIGGCGDEPYGTNYFWWNWDGSMTAPVFTQCPTNRNVQYCTVLNDGVLDPGAPPCGDYWLGQIFCGGNGPYDRCRCGSGTSTQTYRDVSFAQIGEQEVIVKIPIVP